MINDPKLHREIIERTSREWTNSEYARTIGERDLILARRTQWDDDIDENVDTQYRGQFDIIKPERRRILSELMRVEFSCKFRADSEETEDLAEILEGYYRKMTRTNTSKIAAEVAITEALDCGTGAWRIEVVDEDETDPLNTNRKPKRTPIHEANNKVIWDANSKLIDKSDAKHCTVVTSMTEDAFDELCEEYGLGEGESDFPLPDYANVTQLWQTSAQTRTIAEYYEVKERKQKVTILSDGIDMIALTAGEMSKQGDWYKSIGYEKVNTKTKVVRDVWKSVVTGAHILEHKKIAGKHIPIVSIYGEWGFIGSVEYYEGIVRMLRDPQQLKNMIMSYSFDLLAKGPIEKEIWAQEQIDGYEHLYEEQNKYNFSFYMQNLKGPDGNDLPLGPLGKRAGPQVPQSAMYLIDQAERSVSQSVGGGFSAEQMINPQVTEDQLQFIKARLDQQTILYQEHLEYAYRREGEIISSILAEIIDNEREISIMSADGAESRVTVNEVTTNYSGGDLIIKNDMSKASLEVFTDVGLSYATQKEKVRAEMRELMEKPISPEDAQMAQWIYAMNLEGPEYKPMRDKARKNMVLGGYVDEKELTDDERQMLAQAQQQQGQAQPDAMMIAAMAEDKKAQAQIMGEQNDADKVKVDMFNAETKRMEAMIKAEELGVKLNLEQFKAQAEVRNKNADTVNKMREAQTGQMI